MQKACDIMKLKCSMMVSYTDNDLDKYHEMHVCLHNF